MPVSAETDEWIAAEVLRDEFAFSLDEIDSAHDLPSDEKAAVELLARFLGFISQRLHEDTQLTSARTALLLSVYKHFVSTHLSAKDVHSLTSSYDTESRHTVLSSYFQAFAALEEQNVSDIPSSPPSALLSAALGGKASIYALFGGQGTNEVYFDELQFLYDTYKPFVAPFINTITKDVLEPLAASREDTMFFNYGMNIPAWLSSPAQRPSLAYIASIPVSSPLIGLTQLIQYLVVCRVSGLTPGDLRKRIAGTTGHSQGIVSAVAIAASSTFDSFQENASKAVKWLFFSGCRAQQAFPVVSLEPAIVQDAVEGGEGVPSPMLSVTGLSLKDLESQINNANSHLPEGSKLFLSLHNGPKAYVATGPACVLFGLVTSLRKCHAAVGLDQGKMPF